jgi:hypothetical protein
VHARRFVLALATLALASALGSASVAAQGGRVDVTLPDRELVAKQPPAIRTTGIVVAPHTAELIRNGFPARLHYRLERWAAGTFVNSVKATVEWEVYVEYDALNEKYRVVRATDRRAVILGEFATLKDADAKLSEPYRIAISLPKSGEKTYYTVKLDVEAMSLSDLDEVRRWLRGELQPAVRGRRNPGTAVTSGVRTLFVRILGGERLQYEGATGVVRP